MQLLRIVAERYWRGGFVMSQSKKGSLLEAFINVAIGYGVAVASQSVRVTVPADKKLPDDLSDRSAWPAYTAGKVKSHTRFHMPADSFT